MFVRVYISFYDDIIIKLYLLQNIKKNSIIIIKNLKIEKFKSILSIYYIT